LSFTSVEFLLFLVLFALLYRLCPRRIQATCLLASSYLFYSATSWEATLALAASTLLAFFAALLIERFVGSPAARGVALGATFLLTAYLIFFKALPLLPHTGWARLVMPLGLSYYSFKLISYVLDVYWGKLRATGNIVSFAAFVAFFPQIVAGPIERAIQFLPQIGLRPAAFSDALPRIAWGLFKKLVIADHLAPAVNAAFGNVAGSHAGPLWLAFYLWPLQLYADFSGLTDIAIGAGKLFGIVGPENFNRPFTASSISDYWRRWHMSLTRWLGDYVFTPLRMATRDAGKWGLSFSIAINMIAIGLWHGMNWGFFAFGVVHAVCLIIDSFSLRARKSWFKRHAQFDRAGDWLGWLLTFHVVAIALVFFRANSVSDAALFLSSLLPRLAGLNFDLNQLGPAALHSLAIGLAGYLVLELGERFRPDLKWRGFVSGAPRSVRWSYYATATLVLSFGLLLLLAGGGGAKNPFLYAVF
jgi:alginate O-acetyltransferase complex protein AlgI